LQDLTAFANTYRHLGVAEIINDKGLHVSKKKKAIIERIKLLDKLYKNNPKLALDLVNFFDNNSKLNWKGIAEGDKSQVRKQLMAYQRVLNIAEDTEGGKILLSKGYDSAMLISDMTKEQFVETSSLEEGKARMAHNKAQEYIMVVENILRKCIHLMCTIQGYRKGKD
jgi:hypothetical protein